MSEEQMKEPASRRVGALHFTSEYRVALPLCNHAVGRETRHEK